MTTLRVYVKMSPGLPASHTAWVGVGAGWRVEAGVGGLAISATVVDVGAGSSGEESEPMVRGSRVLVATACHSVSMAPTAKKVPLSTVT